MARQRQTHPRRRRSPRSRAGPRGTQTRRLTRRAGPVRASPLPLTFDTNGKEEGAPAPQITDELRIFNLLAEVRIYKRAGENWVTWYYPPSIREELVSPSRWAQVDFAVLRQLTTYCAVALYEMCARYRDSPAGVTSRQHWTWWAETLRSSPSSKVRAWRKFKNGFVTPAIKEINELGDIEIELIEFRRGREVEYVQFA